MSRRSVGVVAVFTGFFVWCPSLASCQSLGIASGRDLPEWVLRWSPLNDAGTLTRHLPSASPAVLSLLYPVEQVGSFWTAGNPAALAWEVGQGRSELTAARAKQEGSYRRPLDPGASTVTRVGGLGWQRLGENGAAAGNVLFDRTISDPGAMSDVNEPYSSNPLVVTDSSTSALRQSRARLEGAAGWRFNGWGVGVAAGYDTRTTATTAAAFVRRNRAVLPAVTVGVERKFGDGRFEIGARAGWQGGEETTNLSAVGGAGVVFQLQGYREVPRLVIGQIPFFYRRTSRGAFIGGASFGGRSGRLHWLAYADGLTMDARSTGQRADDPSEDIWSTEGSTFGGAVQLALARNFATITINAKTVRLSGHAELFPGKTGLRASERESSASGELRLQPTSNIWSGLINVSLVGERRERSDSVAAAATIVDAVTPRVAIELSRTISRRISVIGGYAFARYAGTGTIPSADSRGPLFRRVFAPELDIATSVLWVHAGSIALRWQSRLGTAVWIAGRFERLSSQSEDRVYAPRGNRTAPALTVGVTMPRQP